MVRFPEVRVIGPDNEQFGVMSSREAYEIARGRDLDLVLIAETAHPPVCKIMNYGKYKYEQSKKQKENKKKQVKTSLKEIKLHPHIEAHDYGFKMKHAKAFLIKGHKVKVSMVFRGRENMYKDLGKEVLEKVDKDLSILGTAERMFVSEGRTMMSNYNPDAKKIRQYQKDHPEEFSHLDNHEKTANAEVEKDNAEVETTLDEN